MSPFLKHAEEIFLVAREGGLDDCEMSILVSRDGSIHMLSGADWELEPLRIDHGARAAYRISRKDGGVRLEACSADESCMLRIKPPAHRRRAARWRIAAGNALIDDKKCEGNVMSQNAHDTYQESRRLSADPIELIHMLYQEAARAIRDARRHLGAGDIAARARSITQAGAVVIELATSLDHERGGEISANLARLYDYILRRLTEANLQQSDQPLAEVLGLLGTLSEGWDAMKTQGVVVPAMRHEDSLPEPAAPKPAATYGSSWAQPAQEPAANYGNTWANLAPQEPAASYSPQHWSL